MSQTKKIRSESPVQPVLMLALFIATLGVLLHFLFGHSWTTISGHAIGSDDAYISYRYAWNLFNGNGLVFNLNEYVEGYSNLLYLLLITPAFFVSKHFVYIYSVILNILFINLALILYFNFIRKKLDVSRAKTGVMIVALSPFVWSNAATGLETPLVILINLAIWVCVEGYFYSNQHKQLLLLIFLSLLSVLTRVDGFITPLICCVYLFLNRRYPSALTLAFSIFVFMGTYTLFRYGYYHDVISNTFYNKMSGELRHRISQGIIYWCYYLFETGMIISIGLYICLSIPKKINLKKQAAHEKKPYQFISFPILLISLWLLCLIYTGGDIYYERFLIALLPATTFLFLIVKNELSKPIQHYFVFVLIVTPFLFVFYDGRFSYQYPKYDSWVAVGKFLKKQYPHKRLAVDACGKIPFYSELPTLDMLGLTERHIAKLKAKRPGLPGHTKFDPHYVLKQSPDIITTWIGPSLNMGYGLKRALYQKHYQLHFLVNSSRHDLLSKNIVDVRRLSHQEIIKMISHGPYNYAILTKR